jgi:hypothetical protein
LATQLIESLFYRFVQSSDKDVAGQSLKEIKSLLKAGKRSPGTIPEANVQRAIEGGFPDPAFSRHLADAIIEKEDIKTLGGFAMWKEISGSSQ